MKTKYYDRFSNLNFIRSRSLNKIMGIEYFRWIIKNSFFRFFNQKIKLENKSVDLNEIRKEMTIAEVSHLIAFLLVSVFAVYKSLSDGVMAGMLISVGNVLLNLYPSLLQQENKRRLDRLIKRQAGL
ncbi:glycosyl-4,4'-diaponeurosporenoate acyltransferase CrtO family protein [Fulvitalea axinellae]